MAFTYRHAYELGEVWVDGILPYPKRLVKGSALLDDKELRLYRYDKAFFRRDKDNWFVVWDIQDVEHGGNPRPLRVTVQVGRDVSNYQEPFYITDDLVVVPRVYWNSTFDYPVILAAKTRSGQYIIATENHKSYAYANFTYAVEKTVNKPQPLAEPLRGTLSINPNNAALPSRILSRLHLRGYDVRDMSFVVSEVRSPLTQSWQGSSDISLILLSHPDMPVRLLFAEIGWRSHFWHCWRIPLDITDAYEAFCHVFPQFPTMLTMAMMTVQWQPKFTLWMGYLILHYKNDELLGRDKHPVNLFPHSAKPTRVAAPVSALALGSDSTNIPARRDEEKELVEYIFGGQVRPLFLTTYMTQLHQVDGVEPADDDIPSLFIVKPSNRNSHRALCALEVIAPSYACGSVVDYEHMDETRRRCEAELNHSSWRKLHYRRQWRNGSLQTPHIVHVPRYLSIVPRPDRVY